MLDESALESQLTFTGAYGYFCMRRVRAYIVTTVGLLVVDCFFPVFFSGNNERHTVINKQLIRRRDTRT